MALTDIDRNLLARCLEGQPGAWRNFVDRFLGLLVHVVHHAANARSVPLTPELVEDLCGEVFFRLLENDFAILRRFRGRSSLATYLAVVARRVIVKDMTRRRMAEAMGHVSARGVESGRGAEAASGDRHERRIEDRDEVERLLAQLPAQEAEIVRRYHLLGMSYRDIGRELNVPENTIGPTLSRARARLRERPIRS